MIQLTFFFVNFSKSLLIIISYYIFSILEKDTIYDLSNFKIYKESNFFLYSILLSLSYLILSFFLQSSKDYQRNFISFLKQDIFNLIISKSVIFSFFFISKKNFQRDLVFLYSIIFLVVNFAIIKIFFNSLFDKMVDKNIIQKNIMIVGTFDDIRKILKENLDKIYVIKCCIVIDLKNHNEKLLKSEIKFPVFKEDEDIRAILEYHALGQIWLLDSDDLNLNNSLSKIIKWSVDILIVNLRKQPNLKGEHLLVNKYKFEFYEISRFHGVNLFLKIILDKILSILFLILVSPILIISCLAIYLEDGFPLIFTQNRTGWDGRRFKIFKLRTLKKENFDKTKQVVQGDKRVLNSGEIIRKYSIDEVPQFINDLFGDMSIVGPRPHMVEHDIKYLNLFQNFLKRHKCNPGLTGWAQVNGFRGATPNPEAMRQRMDHDLWYLNNWTVFLDIYIIFKTFYVIFKYKGD